MSKDTTFYNKEGAVYSAKRYPKEDTDFNHFFFKTRRRILMRLLGDIVRERKGDLSLLEVGCADGVVIREINHKYPTISPLTGIDISPAMIEQARILALGTPIEFFVRGEEAVRLVDIVIEVGVINLTDMDTEIRFALQHLPKGGYYICSLAARTSLRSRFKVAKGDFQNHLTFPEYESILRRHFDIVQAETYGLFIPFLWKVPAVARLVQPICEICFRRFVPALFHEKIYLLRRH